LFLGGFAPSPPPGPRTASSATKRAWTPKNLKKPLINNVFKVLKILKGAELARLFSKVP
jgi:hypothetical protein